MGIFCSFRFIFGFLLSVFVFFIPRGVLWSMQPKKVEGKESMVLKIGGENPTLEEISKLDRKIECERERRDHRRVYPSLVCFLKSLS